jgi:hypothetical protein
MSLDELDQRDDFDDYEERPQYDDRDRRDDGDDAQGWEPPEDVLTHAGTPIPEDMDFFVPPPPKLGKVMTAWSTLKMGQDAKSPVAKLLIAGSIGVAVAAVVAVIAAAAFGRLEPGVLVLAAGLGLLVMLIAWFTMRFKHTCSYVCAQGIIRYTLKGHRDADVTSEVLAFRQAANLNAGQTRHYTNGIYTGTNYDFAWTDDEGHRLLRLSGSYHSKTGNPKPKDPFHLARAGEIAWNVHLSERLQSELDEYGSIEFPVNKRDVVRVGPGFLEFDFKGQVNRVPAAEIKSLSINNGTFSIHTTDAKWFGSKGKFSFNYSQLGNAGMFVFALEQLLGYRFD